MDVPSGFFFFFSNLYCLICPAVVHFSQSQLCRCCSQRNNIHTIPRWILQLAAKPASKCILHSKQREVDVERFRVIGQKKPTTVVYAEWCPCVRLLLRSNLQRLSGGDFCCPWRDAQLVKSFPRELFHSLRIKEWT